MKVKVIVNDDVIRDIGLGLKKIWWRCYEIYKRVIL